MSGSGGLSQEEAFARIRLLRSPNVGPVTYAQLLFRFGSGLAAIEALPDVAGRGGRSYTPAPESAVHDEIAAVRKAGARYLFHDAYDYPAFLRQSEGAPPILTYRGDIAALGLPCVAIVGARNASAGAMKIAREIAYELADQGWAVVSGLARGIDGAAHMGALASKGRGATIGVIASGIDIVYPPEHASLHHDVAEYGLLLAEQPPRTEPLARHFPTRNRVIAGICAGTLVVEAAPKSGSLITARLAGEMGREVMAVPGSPLDPRSQGCNHLIREGAILVQNAQEVIELMSGFSGFSGNSRSLFREVGLEWIPEDDSTAYAGRSDDVVGLLTTAPVAVDEIIRQSGAGTATVQMALLELELAGRLVRHAGARVSLK